jgi:RHS repeat-associated protein
LEGKKEFMKNTIVAVMGLMLGLGSLQAAKLVTDSLPGLPGQSDAYWSERRQEQAGQQRGQSQFVNLREVAVKQSVTYQENEPVNFYTGKPYDAELGSYIFKFRNYNPETQRWNSADPSGFPDGANNYTYASNQPIFIIDDNGLTGKKVLVVFIMSGNAADDTVRDGVKRNVEGWNEQMTTWDSQNTEGNYYTKDDDILNYGLFTQAQSIGAFSDYYDKIYAVIHGVNTGTVTSPNWSGFNSNGTVYTRQQLLDMGFTNIAGCGSLGLVPPIAPGLPAGVLTATDCVGILARGNNGFLKYLYE